MADVIYKVGVELSSTGDLGGKLDGISNSANKLSGNLGRMSGHLINSFTGAIESVVRLGATMATVAAGALTTAVVGVSKLNAELEMTNIALADLFKSSGATTTMVGGMELAGNIMAKMRVDAAALPGEFKDLANIFQMSAVSGLQNGKNADEIEKMSAKVMAFGIGAAHLTGPIIARQLAGLLEGHATAANNMSRKLGIDARDFNKKSYSERFAEVSEKLSKHDDAIPYYEKSFTGIWTSLIDKGKLFLTEATEPLFAAIKNSLGQILDWFGDNGATTTNWAEKIGKILGDAWKHGSDFVMKWAPKMESMAYAFKDAVLSAFEKIKPIAEYIWDKFGNIDSLLHGMEGYAVLKLAGLVLSSGGGAALAAVGAPALAAGAAVAVVGAAMIAAPGDKELAVEDAALKGDVYQQWNMAIAKMQLRMNELEPTFKELTNTVSTLGFAIADSTLHVANGLWDANRGISGFIVDMFKNQTQLNADTDALIQFSKSVKDETIDRSNLVSIGGLTSLVGRAEPNDPKKNRSNQLPTGNGAVNIARIEINVEQTGDPERVARAVMDKVVDFRRFATASPFVPNISAVPRR